MSDAASDASPVDKNARVRNSDDDRERSKKERRSKRKIDDTDDNDKEDRQRRKDRNDSRYHRRSNGGRSSRDRDRRRRRSRDRDRSRERYSNRNENDRSYRNDRDGNSKDGAPLRRYWSVEKRNSDQYWNKYPANKDERIGQRFYGGRHEERADSTERRFEDKENNDDVERKRRNENASTDNREKITPAQKRTVDLLTSRTGGAYIPPAKLRMMQAEITDKSGAAYQRISWEALKKSIHGYINKVNTSNIGLITRELLHENIVRGRGLLARSIIQAQAASPTFTPIYAALTAVINSKVCNLLSCY